MSAPAIPVQRIDFATDDPEAAYAALRDIYVTHRPRLTRPPQVVDFRVRSASAGGLRADFARNSLEAATETDPMPGLMSLAVLNGRLAVDDRRTERRLAPGDVTLFHPDLPCSESWAGLDIAVVTIAPEIVRRVAAERLGIDVVAFRFDDTRPVSPGLGRYWRDLLRWITRELNSCDTALTEPIVLAQTSTMLAVALMRVFPHSATQAGPTRSAGPAEPATVRRAVAFIDANAHRPVTLTDIAAAARTSPRGLQRAFAHHRGSGPMAYLRAVRLDHAHRELRAAEPGSGDTVAAIAARWGYARPSHFTAAYRAAFGRLPRDTLRE